MQLWHYEAAKTRRWLPDAAAAAEDLTESENYASQIMAKKRKLTLPSLEWIPPTSNSAERICHLQDMSIMTIEKN